LDAVRIKVHVGDVEFNLARIPAGTFLMGSTEKLPCKNSNNSEDQHRVTISKPFYMGVSPITQAQYQAVMNANPSHFKGDDLPVEQVSWDDAVNFCQTLSRKTGRHFRLPTEAEWEYSCRAGTTTRFNTGKAIRGKDQANFDDGYLDDEDNLVTTISRKATTPVGRFPANAWGLYDMHGNVWEWCADWLGKYPTGPETDPKGPDGGTSRVMRGGSWQDIESECRSANRSGLYPNFHYEYLGFRVVLD
jgi:formylglycine-generating enzyme required for sulfatase activity